MTTRRQILPRGPYDLETWSKRRMNRHFRRQFDPAPGIMEHFWYALETTYQDDVDEYERMETAWEEVMSEPDPMEVESLINSMYSQPSLSVVWNTLEEDDAWRGL